MVPESDVLVSKGNIMNKTEVCMFCRYRRTRGAAAASCCAGQEALRSTAEAERPSQGLARAMPERLRSPAPRPPLSR